jgi:O-antigen/teichoic acid export membrane protein
MSIAFGGIVAFAFRLLNLFIAFATIWFTSHQLSEAEYGLFALSLTVIGLANALTGGLTAATAYQVANQRRSASVAFANGASLGGALGVCAVLAGLVAGAVTAGDPSHVALPVGLAAAAVIVNSVIGGAYLGREAIVRYNLTLVAPPFLALAFIGVTFRIFDAQTPPAALWAYAAAQWVGLTLMVVAGGSGLLAGLRVERSIAATIFRFALLAGVSSGISFLNYRADQFVVRHYEGKEGVGTYSLAVYMAEAVWQVSGSVALAAYARLGSLPRPDAVLLTTRVMRHSLILVGVICLGLFVVAGLIEDILFPKYEGMAGALRWILPGVFIYATAQSFSGFYTYQRGLPWVSAIVAGAGLIVDLALDFVLVPRMGINGASLASTLAYSIAMAGGLAVFFRQERISPLEVFRFGRRDLDDYRQLAGRLRAVISR